MATTTLFHKANEAFVSEDYDAALALYSEAIAQGGGSDELFCSRAQAHIKLANYKEAEADADQALALNPDNPKAYMRKGIASYSLEDYELALKTFMKGMMLEGEDKKFETWVKKCEEALEMEKKRLEAPESASQAVSASSGADAAPVPPAPIPMPAGPQTRYDWYQTETHVIVTIMLKKVQKEDLAVDITERTLSATVRLPASSDYSLELDLAHPVIPAQCQTKILSTKVEVKLKKADGFRWAKLEGDGESTKTVKQFKADASGEPRKPQAYPSSSHYTRDWDKLVTEIKAEEKDEQLEGDAALNKLFQQIYSDGSEETRKAMNKSFMESGGTVLSTNWKDIGTKKTDIKPPDGMEYKSWN